MQLRQICFLSIITIFTATTNGYGMEPATAGPAESPAIDAPSMASIARSFKNIERHREPITAGSPILLDLHTLEQEFSKFKRHIATYHGQTIRYRDLLNQTDIIIGHIQRHLESASQAASQGNTSAFEHTEKAHREAQCLFENLAHFVPSPEKGFTRPIRQYARAIINYPQETAPSGRLDTYAGLAGRLLNFAREVKETVAGDVRTAKTALGALNSTDDLVSLERMAQDYTSATRQGEPESRTSSGASSPQEPLLPESLEDAAKMLQEKGEPFVKKAQAEVLAYIDLEGKQPGSLKETVEQAIRPPIGPTTATLTAPFVRTFVPDAVLGWFIGSVPPEHRQRKIDTCRNALGDLGRAYLFANRAWQTYVEPEGVEKTTKFAYRYVNKTTQVLPQVTACALAAPDYVAKTREHLAMMGSLGTTAKTADDAILQTLCNLGQAYQRYQQLDQPTPMTAALLGNPGQPSLSERLASLFRFERK